MDEKTVNKTFNKTFNKADREYEKNIWLFSILGYVYIAAIVLAAILLAGIAVLGASKVHGAYYAAFKVVSLLGVFLFLVIKALWVKFDKPEGLEVNVQNLPKLAGFVSETCAEVGGPKEYKVLLTDELNACIIQHPRLGMLGWYKNYVCIGAPLIMITSPEELKSVLAHEFAHLKETHGVWGSKIHRNREVWIQIMENLEEKRHWGTFIFKGFFKWYIPKLDEYSLSMRRAHELEADRESVRVAGKEAFGGFQLKYEIYSDRISNQFWREIFRKMQTYPEPQNGVFEDLDSFLKIPVEREFQQKIIARNMKGQTDDRSTHPSLKERLENAGYNPAVFEMKENSAEDQLLGTGRADTLKSLSEHWKQEISPYWKYKFDEFQQLQDDLMELEKADKTEENLLLRARILEELDRGEEAHEKYDEILELNPKNIEALFSKGEILISGEETGEEGKRIIDKVMEQDGEYCYLGTKLVYDYLLQHGRKEEAAAYRDRGIQEAERLDEALEERNTVTVKDSFMPHGLSGEQLEELVEQLKSREKIKEVYLVRKEVQHYAQEPLYILGVLFKSSNKKFMFSALEEIAENVVFPGETQVMMFNEENPRFYKMYKKVENALILKNS